MKMVTSTLTTMPPTDGMAIGCITSEPRPVAQKMGIRPKMVVEIVIRQGRMRFQARLHDGVANVLHRVEGRLVEYVFQVGRDDDTVVVHDAEQDEEPDPHRDGEVHAPQREHDESARRRHEDAEEDDGRDPPALEAEVEHHEHDEHAQRHEDAHALRGTDLVLELAAPFPVVACLQLEPAITHGALEKRFGIFDHAHLVAVARVHRDVAHEQSALAFDFLRAEDALDGEDLREGYLRAGCFIMGYI